MSFLADLATLIPKKLFEYLLVIINAPLLPLLELIKKLLSEPVNISPFSSLWSVMIYVISLFYGLLLLYSGFNFIISGHDAAKRENAKTWLRNIIIMVVLVQASFFLYAAVLEISSLLTISVLDIVNQNFFLLTVDNLANFGLELLFGIVYVAMLLLTVILLTVRYLIVSVGVVFVPIAIFLYFIPPLKSYGRLIINFLGVCIFTTFFDAVIILASSKLVEIPLYANFKILLMISAFLLINLLMFYFMFFAAIKSALGTTRSIIGNVKMIKSLFG